MNTTQRLKHLLEQKRKENSIRTLKPLSASKVDFCSNDYLGISRGLSMELLKNLPEQLTVGSGGSRLLAGHTELAQTLEKLLAKTHRTQAALLFNSGYNANIGFFSAVPDKRSTVIYDQKIHACIKDGMRLGLAHKISFGHNDLAQLEAILGRTQGEKFVAVESIYSLDGDCAPLNEMAFLCQKYGANLVVDEAHSTAIYGPQGAGLVTELGLDELVFAKVHTFGKGTGAHGACVASSQEVVDYLINTARSFIYTTALSSHSVHVLIQIYHYLSKHWEGLQSQLNRNIRTFKEHITQQTIQSESPIQVVVVPGNDQVRALSSRLQALGFEVRPVISPSVPLGQERIRICLHSYNTPQEIKQLALAINQYR